MKQKCVTLKNAISEITFPHDYNLWLRKPAIQLLEDDGVERVQDISLNLSDYPSLDVRYKPTSPEKEIISSWTISWVYNEFRGMISVHNKEWEGERRKTGEHNV